MKSVITLSVAALLMSGVAFAHDAKKTADGKSSCPMHTATADAKKAEAKDGKSCHGEAKQAAAEGMSCCAKGKHADAAATTDTEKPAANSAAMACDHDGKAGHATHAKGECEGKMEAGKEGMSCCAKHAKSDTDAPVAPAAPAAPSKS